MVLKGPRNLLGATVPGKLTWPSTGVRGGAQPQHGQAPQQSQELLAAQGKSLVVEILSNILHVTACYAARPCPKGPRGQWQAARVVGSRQTDLGLLSLLIKKKGTAHSARLSRSPLEPHLG